MSATSRVLVTCNEVLLEVTQRVGRSRARVQVVRFHGSMQHRERIERNLSGREARLKDSIVERELNVAAHGQRNVGVVVNHKCLTPQKSNVTSSPVVVLLIILLSPEDLNKRSVST